MREMSALSLEGGPGPSCPFFEPGRAGPGLCGKAPLKGITGPRGTIARLGVPVVLQGKCTGLTWARAAGGTGPAVLTAGEVSQDALGVGQLLEGVTVLVVPVRLATTVQGEDQEENAAVRSAQSPWSPARVGPAVPGGHCPG